MRTTVDGAQKPVGSNVCESAATQEQVSVSRTDALARFAWLVMAYNIAVILWGAYVRATGSGAGCGSHWPLCNGEILPSTAQSQTLIEFTHRVTSGLSLVLVSALLIWCWRSTAKGEWPRYSAVSAAVLLFNEALLGAMLVISAYVGINQSASRAVILCLHFGNTLLLVAALTLTAKWLSSGPRRFVPAAKHYDWTMIGFGLLSIMATGMTGSLAALGDTIFPAATLRASITQDFSSSSHVLLRLRLFHPVTAAIAFLYVLWMVYSLSKSREQSSRTLPFLTTIVVAQLALGVLNVLLLAPVWLQITHLLVAELLWIVLVLASSEILLKTAEPLLKTG